MARSMSNRGISLNQVAQIESNLDPQELYSSIFLLYDDVEMALQDIHLESRSPKRTSYVLDSALFRSGSDNFQYGVLVRWARYSIDRDQHWEDRLLEALLLIKNYMCIQKILGKNQKDLELIFSPSQINKSYHVNLVRKVLFLMVEDLSIAQWNQLQKRMIDEARYIGIEVPSEYCNVQESFLLFLLSRNVLKTKTGKDKRMDFNFLCKCLRQANCFDWAGKLQKTEDLVNSEGSRDSRFNLDPDNQGTILIFNQQDYGEKFRKEVKLEYREGSQLDCARLKKTFELLNFKVLTKVNTSAAEMCLQIRKSVEKFCSECKDKDIQRVRCFVVAVLAHGDQDGVICTDGKDVSWERIRQELRNSDMVKLPRLILSQACKGLSQGMVFRVPTRSCLKWWLCIIFILLAFLVAQTVKGFEVFQDGGGNFSGNLRNLFEFHSCVSGFAAYRSKAFGSFFISSFCKHVLEFGRMENIMVIATLVNRDLEGQQVNNHGKNVAMIPEYSSTLSKLLYLAVPECNMNEVKMLLNQWDKGFQNQTMNCQKETKLSDDEELLPSVNDDNKCTISNNSNHHPESRGSAMDEVLEALRAALKK